MAYITFDILLKCKFSLSTIVNINIHIWFRWAYLETGSLILLIIFNCPGWGQALYHPEFTTVFRVTVKPVTSGPFPQRNSCTPHGEVGIYTSLLMCFMFRFPTIRSRELNYIFIGNNLFDYRLFYSYICLKQQKKKSLISLKG